MYVVKPALRGPHIKWTPSIKWTQLQLGTLMTLNVKNQSIALAPILTSAFCYSQERANHTSDFLKIFNSGGSYSFLIIILRILVKSASHKIESHLTVS